MHSKNKGNKKLRHFLTYFLDTVIVVVVDVAFIHKENCVTKWIIVTEMLITFPSNFKWLLFQEKSYLAFIKSQTKLILGV